MSRASVISTTVFVNGEEVSKPAVNNLFENANANFVEIYTALGDGTNLNVGTMATQDANAVDITGGTISGVMIGSATATALTVTDLTVKGTFTIASPLSISEGGTGAKDATTALTNLGAASSSIKVGAGTGLSGGGTLAADLSIALADTAVTPGSYTHTSITVDQQGRITSASSGTVTTGTVTKVNTGTGLGGGPITTTGTIALADTSVSPGSYALSILTVDQQGRITKAASATAIDSIPIGATSASTGAFTTLTASAAVTLSPSNANVTLSPSGTGLVAINPTKAGSIDNMVIGATTKAAATVTTLTATGQTSLGGTAGIEAARFLTNASWVNRAEFSGATAGNTPKIAAAGSDASIGWTLQYKAGGTAGYGVIVADENGNQGVFLGRSTGANTFGPAVQILGAVSTTPARITIGATLQLSPDNLNIFGLGSTPNFQSGSGIMLIQNRAAAPTGNPSGGGFLYCEGGALVYRGSGGTITTIAPA